MSECSYHVLYQTDQTNSIIHVLYAVKQDRDETDQTNSIIHVLYAVKQDRDETDQTNSIIHVLYAVKQDRDETDQTNSIIHVLLNRIGMRLIRQTQDTAHILTTHSTHFIYGYMASDIWLRTILIAR